MAIEIQPNIYSVTVKGNDDIIKEYTSPTEVIEFMFSLKGKLKWGICLSTDTVQNILKSYADSLPNVTK